jgi:hypothetical protein
VTSQPIARRHVNVSATTDGLVNGRSTERRTLGKYLIASLRSFFSFLCERSRSAKFAAIFAENRTDANTVMDL